MWSWPFPCFRHCPPKKQPQHCEDSVNTAALVKPSGERHEGPHPSQHGDTDQPQRCCDPHFKDKETRGPGRLRSCLKLHSSSMVQEIPGV